MDNDPNEEQPTAPFEFSPPEPDVPTDEAEISLLEYIKLKINAFFRRFVFRDFGFRANPFPAKDVQGNTDHPSEQSEIIQPVIPEETPQDSGIATEDTASPPPTSSASDQTVHSFTSQPVEIFKVQDGSRIRVSITADIPEGMTLHVTIHADTNQAGEPSTNITLHRTEPGAIEKDAATAPDPAAARKTPMAKPVFNLSWSPEPLLEKVTGTIRPLLQRTDTVLIGIAIAVYALVISIGIDRFPIYFFTDEAIHMNLAANFLRDGFKNYFGELFPTFFTVDGWVNGVSVYAQLVPYLIFGKSVIVTRLVSAIISLFGALAVSLLLKNVFKLKTHWIGILLVLTTPAWFLHARTAFEYVEVGSFYSIFLYFYSRYRAGESQYIYAALVAGALAFYTHGLGQILIGITGLALLLMDFRYHFAAERRKIILKAAGLLVLLLLPFVRYYLAHPGEAADQMMRRQSYWTSLDLNFGGILMEFFHQYSYGLVPLYWYFPNSVDLSRHIMKGYGNGLWFTLPLAFIGLIITIRNLRQPAYRIMLVALLACPVPASIVAIGMPRMLWMTIPLALLTAIGVDWLVTWLAKKFDFKFAYLQFALMAILVSGSFWMLNDALQNGPTWFTDYSLYGMQYGALQVFGEFIQPEMVQHPDRQYVVSPSWANGTDQFADFFIPAASQSRVHMGQPINYLDDIRKNPDNIFFVATTDEYNKLLANPKFKDIVIQKIIYFPDKTPGFYVITLHPADNLDEILKAEHEANVKPVEDNTTINGVQYQVWHSPLGMGQIGDVFDADPNTLIRGLEANPLVFDLYPASAQVVHGLTFKLGSMAKFTVTISLYTPQSDTAIVYTQTFTNFPGEREFSMNFDRGPDQVSRIYIEIKDELSGVTGQVHVRTIQIH